MEIWRDIDGYEGKWQASNNGNIRSLDHVVRFGNNQRIAKGQVLKFNKHRSGYLLVHVGKKRTVHRIIATVFIPNPNNLPEVNHIDGNKTNNFVNNLEWCSRKENVKHDIRLSGKHKRKQRHNKVTDLQMEEIKKSTELKKNLCHKYNISRSMVGRIQAGLTSRVRH